MWPAARVSLKTSPVAEGQLSLLYRCQACGGALLWVLDNRQGRELLIRLISGGEGEVTLYLGQLEHHRQVEPCTCLELDSD